MTSIAIIGAGLAGLTLAHQLGDVAPITLFEKSRGYGGRLATRYAPPYEFDHGAQFFTARSDEFRDTVAEWQAAGVVAPWRARFTEFDRGQVLAMRDWDEDYPHYVGTPRMNAIGRHLAKDLDIRLETKVERIEPGDAGWQLFADDQPLGTFDWVVTTAPAAQSAALLPAAFAHHAVLRDTPMQACFALMLGFAAAPALDWQAALVHNADISWISVNSSKPGRGAEPALLIHSTNAYATAHLDAPSAQVIAHLAAELLAVAGVNADDAAHCDLHRWRYANIDQRRGEPALLDAGTQLAACGDWCIRGRVEAAFTSGWTLASRLRGVLC